MQDLSAKEKQIIKVVRVKRMRKRYHERTEGERGDNKISIKLVLPKTKK